MNAVLFDSLLNQVATWFILSFVFFVFILYACAWKIHIEMIEEKVIHREFEIRSIFGILFDMLTFEIFVPKIRQLTMWSTALGMQLYTILYGFWRLYG